VQGFQVDARVYRNLGAILGHEVAKVALGLSYIPADEALREVIPFGAPLGLYEEYFPILPSLPFQVVEREIAVPLREALPEARAAAEDLQQWKERLKIARAKGNEAAVTQAIDMARRAAVQVRMAEDFGGRRDAGICTQFICFGDVALVSSNIEPFCEIGLAIKRQSPFPFTLVSGYSNGGMAYLPTAEEWVRGGYEVENSPFERGAAKVLEREILATLDALRRSSWESSQPQHPDD